jgi:DNA-binding transcriptional ArsR family regulator
MEQRRDVFQGIADPTRREILNMIAGKALNLNTIAEKFDMSRQAISLHIKILTECGLITIEQQGRERLCEAKPKKLNEVSLWLDNFRRHYEEKLDSLEDYLQKLQTTKKKNNGKQKRKK